MYKNVLFCGPRGTFYGDLLHFWIISRVKRHNICDFLFCYTDIFEGRAAFYIWKLSIRKENNFFILSMEFILSIF